MSDTILFAFGLLAFSVAVGPLMVAAYLDYRDKSR